MIVRRAAVISNVIRVFWYTPAKFWCASQNNHVLGKWAVLRFGTYSERMSIYTSHAVWSLPSYVGFK